jgi:crossover junction endodeoxyribonuclease RusA
MQAAIDGQTAKARAIKLTLTLPLPPRELSPNARLHHFPKAEVTKEYRRRVYIQCMIQRGEWGRRETGRYLVTETYRFADRRKRDVRNLFAAFKAGEDGLVDAGIIPGDDDSVLIHGSPRIERVASKKDEGILVVIEAVV